MAVKKSSDTEDHDSYPRTSMHQSLLRPGDSHGNDTVSHTRMHAESAASASSDAGIVDLVVENEDAEDRERVRARKEGGVASNINEPKIYDRRSSNHSSRTSR